MLTYRLYPLTQEEGLRTLKTMLGADGLDDGELAWDACTEVQRVSSTWAASEMSRMTNSLFAAMSKTSPRVPSCSLKPHARASSSEAEPFLSPIATLMSLPASCNDSRRFCAWAGACSAECRGSGWAVSQQGGTPSLAACGVPRRDKRAQEREGGGKCSAHILAMPNSAFETILRKLVKYSHLQATSVRRYCENGVFIW